MSVFVVLGGKSISQLKRLSRNSYIILIVCSLAAMGIMSAYKEAATSGLLGERALAKYEGQMRGRKSSNILTLLMAGRGEFFVGLYACVKKPILGYGPWAIDKDGFYDDFILKYGDIEDVEKFDKQRQWEIKHGFIRQGFIPSHSYIISFWLWYGIAGLLFWLYVLFQYIRYFKKDLATVPQWFGPLGVFAAPFLWNFFFSPLGSRVLTGIFIVLIMMTRAVRMGTVRLPSEMIIEIQRKAT